MKILSPPPWSMSAPSRADPPGRAARRKGSRSVPRRGSAAARPVRARARRTYSVPAPRRRAAEGAGSRADHHQADAAAGVGPAGQAGQAAARRRRGRAPVRGALIRPSSCLVPYNPRFFVSLGFFRARAPSCTSSEGYFIFFASLPVASQVPVAKKVLIANC